MKRRAAIAVFLLLSLGGGCRGGAKAGRSAAGADSAAGIAYCQGYTVIATQRACRTVALQDVANVTLAPVRGTDGLAAEEDRTGRRLDGVLSDFNQSVALQPLPSPPPDAFRPRRRQEGDGADGLGAGLMPESTEDNSMGSWGWLNSDVQRSEQATAPLRETTPLSWLSIGTDEKDASFGNARLNAENLPGLDEDK
jgi:hypothetical protein